MLRAYVSSRHVLEADGFSFLAVKCFFFINFKPLKISIQFLHIAVFYLSKSNIHHQTPFRPKSKPSQSLIKLDRVKSLIGMDFVPSQNSSFLHSTINCNRRQFIRFKVGLLQPISLAFHRTINNSHETE